MSLWGFSYMTISSLRLGMCCYYFMERFFCDFEFWIGRTWGLEGGVRSEMLKTCLPDMKWFVHPHAFLYSWCSQTDLEAETMKENKEGVTCRHIKWDCTGRGIRLSPGIVQGLLLPQSLFVTHRSSEKLYPPVSSLEPSDLLKKDFAPKHTYETLPVSSLALSHTLAQSSFPSGHLRPRLLYSTAWHLSWLTLLSPVSECPHAQC